MLHKNVLKKTKHPILFLKGLQIRYFIVTVIKNGTIFFSFFVKEDFITLNPLYTGLLGHFADLFLFFSTIHIRTLRNQFPKSFAAYL
jgi:hypothetical protein